jgi:hypothetical protein
MEGWLLRVVVSSFPAEPLLTIGKELEVEVQLLASFASDMEMCKRLTAEPKTDSILEALELEMKGKTRKADVTGEDEAEDSSTFSLT